MKNRLLAVLLTLLSTVSFGQSYQTILTASSESMVNITVDIPEFNTSEVTTPRGEAYVVSIPKTFSTAAAGEPNLPMIAIPVAIGDNALMHVEVTGSEYTDYEGMEIAPSKGDFPRSINPEDVPYTYGPAYQQDAFFPSVIAKLDEPYIHRDVRGQNILLNPITYNPMTKVLRVYHHIELSMVKVGVDTRNIFSNRAKSFVLDPEFKAIYESRYINYSQYMSRYTSIADDGELLIICHDAFMNAMEPFVNWKLQIGRPTTMVGTSTTGSTATAIKSYLQAYYAEHPNLTDILLVGDVGQIPGVYISAGSGWNNYSGYGDLQYGQLAGNDYYNEVIVGRFCCETVDQVTNHVNKVLNYERDLDETATWLSVGQGVSKQEGGGGHFNEDDYQHIDNIRNDLLNYGYSQVHRDYQGVTGVSSSAATISQHINDGVSIINYCNHGSETSWGVFSYSNSNVNALTNDYKLPYIISVACLNGKYDHSGGCFAEAWMRATNNSNGNPTGAIGGMFSYIEQPWIPPMYGQDEMVDILVESYANNIRRTMGGVSINGNMKVLDQGQNQNENKGTYNNWILYGDPTLTLRTAVPAVMSIASVTPVSSTSTSLTMTTTNADGALATLTLDNEILGTATINNGTATINFSAPGRTGEATLTLFGYNKKTFVTSVNITEGGSTTPLLVLAFADPESIVLGESSTLTANASGGTGNYSYSWDPSDNLSDPYGQTTIATPTEVGEITYTVTVNDGVNTASGDVTIIVLEIQPVECPQPIEFDGISYWEDPDFGAHLSWDRASYEYPLDRFEIYRSESGVDFDLVQRIVNTPSINHYECSDPVNRPGLYFYQIIAFYQNGCQSEPLEIQVQVLNYYAVDEQATNSVAVYPNPTTGKVTVASEHLQQINVINSLGQVMRQFQTEGDNVSIDMSIFGRGVYMLMIQTDNGVITKKVIVE